MFKYSSQNPGCKVTMDIHSFFDLEKKKRKLNATIISKIDF